MDTLWRELAVGAVGSVIGAAIVYLASSAASIGKSARTRTVEKQKIEIEMWKTRKIQVRMEITNYYLFEVLRAFLFGTILTVIPSIVSFALFGTNVGMNFTVERFGMVLAVLNAFGLAYFFVGLGQVLRYLTIRRSDEDYLKTYVLSPPEA